MNFFPHLAFFKKMEMCDKFVILRHCQFEKNGYQNRFNINNKWYTMSVSKKTENISEKKYLNVGKDWKNIKNKIEKDMSRFDIDFYFPYDDSYAFLSVINMEIILKIKRTLEIKTKLLSDYPTSLTGTERLVHICQNWGADEYISGPSGKNYLDLKLFDEAGIKVTFQEPSDSVPILEVI